MNIPVEILEKYNMKSLEEYKEDLGYFSETEFFETFLIQTDFIPNKILEGVATSEEYADELYYREFARRQINGGEVTQAVPLDALLSTLLGVE